MSTNTQSSLDRQMSRRQALKLLGGTASMAILAACAPPAAAPSGGAAAPAEKKAEEPMQVKASMNVIHRREYFKKMETLFEDAVKQWASENNIEMNVSTVAAEAFEDFVAKLYAQVQSGNPPDLVYHVRLVQQLYFLDALEPVTDAVEKAESLYGKAPFGQRYQNFIDGEWYGIPYIMSGGGQFARRSIFQEHGIDALKDLVTYDDRRDACLEVSDPANELYGWGVTINRSGDGRGFIESVIQNWGGHYTDAELTKLTFNSPETVAAVEWMAEIYTSDKYAPMLPPGVLSWTDSSNNEAYLAGSIAYTHNAASVYAKAKADGNPVFEDTVVTETPIGPLGKKLEGGGGGQFNIPKGAKQPDLAKELALHLIQPDIFLPISLISAGLFLPAYAGYYQMTEVVEAFDADPNLARMGEAALGDHPGSSWPADPNPFFDAIAAEAILTDMMSQVVAQGVSPADAVAQAEERMAQIADEMEVFG